MARLVLCSRIAPARHQKQSKRLEQTLLQEQLVNESNDGRHTEQNRERESDLEGMR